MGRPHRWQAHLHYRFEWAVNGDPNNGDPNCSAAIDSRGARIEYHFNAQGLPVFERGPEGEVTRTRYNSNGQVLERIDALGHREQFQYNSHGHLVGYTNKLGQQHTFEVNRQGQVLKHTDAAGNSRTNTYTAEGLLASHTDATGATTRYRYNSLGLLCETTNPLAKAPAFCTTRRARCKHKPMPWGKATPTSSTPGAGWPASATHWAAMLGTLTT